MRSPSTPLPPSTPAVVTESDEDLRRREARGWYTIAVLTAAYILSFIDRTILTLLIGPIRADLGLTDTQISLLHGLAFAIFYTTLGIPIALFADRYNRRNIIAAGVAVWSAATAACGLARSYGGLFLARVGVGVGEAALTPAAYSMIADLFPPERLSRALATYALGASAGAGLAYLIGGAIVGAVTEAGTTVLPLVGEVRAWQLVFFIVGLPGLPMALWVMTLHEPQRRRARVDTPITDSARELARHMRTHWKAYASHLMGFSVLALIGSGAGAWLPAYLMRVHELPAAQTGSVLGVLWLVGGVCGTLGGGWVADRLRASGMRDSTLRVGVFSAVAALPFAATATVVDSLPVTIGLLAGLLLFASVPYGAAAAALQMMTPPHLRAAASALYLCCLSLISLGMGPTLVAVVTDYGFGSDTDVGLSIASVSTISAALAAVILWAGLRPFLRAIEAVASRS